MDLKVYALLNEKIKELAGGGLTQAEVEKIVTDEVAKIVAGAPEDFDTLKEMSDWISSHEESAASMNSAIQTNANDISALDTNKVNKVDGKSLISDTEIARLAKVTNYNDSGVKADIQTNADNINTNKTNISTLAKHVTGDLTDSDFSEDSTVAMTKTVPTGMSDYAAIKVIGGKTVKDEENQVLKNAVVESVVSVGKNIAEFSPMTEKTKMNIYGAIEKGKFLKAGKYTLSYQSDYTAFLQVWLVDNMTQIVKDGSAKTITFTLPSDGKYSIYFYKDTTSEGGLANANIRNLQLEKSNEVTPYTQHFKTTLLIPSEARNCVGYGLGISDSVCNIADFENGVYTQAVAKKKLKDITSGWGISSTDGYVYCSGITDKKAGLYNIIFSAFSNNPLASAGSLANGEAKANVSNETVYFMDNTCTTVSAFVSKYGESEVVYELKTPVTTPLKDFIRPLPVENGGTLTLVNEHNLDMPNSIMYKKEVSLS